MPINEPHHLPLAEVLRAANELVAAKLIEGWALGGALAAIYFQQLLQQAELNQTKGSMYFTQRREKR